MGNSQKSAINAAGRALLLGALLGVGLALVFSAGFFVRDLVDMPPVFAQAADTDEPGYPLLDEVQQLLNEHYLREQPTYRQRQYDAIRGLLGGLQDRNTFFIEPPVAQSESDVLAGTYGGIGVTLQRDASGAYLLFPFADGPAAEAGVRDGDRLIAINGETIDPDVHPDAIDQMLRGEVGSGNGVELSYTRDEQTFSQFIEFDVINVPSVQWRVLEENSDVGYIQILRFTSRTPEEMRTAINELRLENIQGVILDLRDNYGGLLQEAIDVASYFLDGGVVLHERTTEDERSYYAEQGGVLTDLPLIVLVNQGTASASELVAGAIQDRDRGLLVGQRTFGKGTIQQIFQLSDASSIHVTSAEWFTPERNVLDGVGLEPDVSMIPDVAGRDVEIEEAVRLLVAELEMVETTSNG
ncbi:MAG: S41 family peptidase [Chloroflexota bacterium]